MVQGVLLQNLIGNVFERAENFCSFFRFEVDKKILCHITIDENQQREVPQRKAPRGRLGCYATRLEKECFPMGNGRYAYLFNMSDLVFGFY